MFSDQPLEATAPTIPLLMSIRITSSIPFAFVHSSPFARSTRKTDALSHYKFSHVSFIIVFITSSSTRLEFILEQESISFIRRKFKSVIDFKLYLNSAIYSNNSIYFGIGSSLVCLMNSFQLSATRWDIFTSGALAFENILILRLS